MLVDEGGEACALGIKHLFGGFSSNYDWYAGGFAHQHGTTLATIGIAEKGRSLSSLLYFRVFQKTHRSPNQARSMLGLRSKRLEATPARHQHIRYARQALTTFS